MVAPARADKFRMLVWTSEFATGIAEIDHDHQQLIAGLNQLEAALQSGAGSRQVPALLDFLERYSNLHFTREEGCMRRLQCPTAAANAAAHEQFRATFARARQRMSSAGAGALVAVQLHRELCDWISGHILRIDSGLKRRHAGTGRNPARHATRA